MTTVAVETLGCAKNSVDSESIAGYLAAHGLKLVEDPSQAEVIIINTCGFITPAKEESINTILELAQYKETGGCRKLIVTGCMAGKYRDQLLKGIPEIDGIVTSDDYSGILAAVGKKDIAAYGCEINRWLPKHLPTTFLKIAEGCDNRCSYCTIPMLRGKYRSTDMDKLVNEARYLTANGVKELVLVAQDTTRYGLDIYGKRMLPQLTKRLSQLEQLSWLRLLYCYPTEFTEDLITVLKDEEKVCRYVDIPLQHVSDKVLRGMGRKSSKSEIVGLLDKLRTEMPDIAIRSTFIVGFPGETEADFQELLAFLEQEQLDWAGAFTFWPEEETPAAGYGDQVPQRIKEERYHLLLETQRKITAAKNQAIVGEKMSVLIEGVSQDFPEYMVGRSQRQAPDVDGVTLVRNVPAEVAAGDFLEVKITAVQDDYDIIGEGIS